MGTTIVKRSQLNSAQFGAGQFNQEISTSETIPDGVTAGLKRSHSGFGHLGQRQYGRSYTYRLADFLTPGGSNPSISVVSSSGTFLGRIRSDVGKPLLREMQFTLKNGNCLDFRMVLNELPSFPIVSKSYLKIDMPGSSFGWYFGQLLEHPEKGDGSEDSYVFTGMGLFQDLDRIDGDGTTFAALTDVGAAVRYIADYIIDPETVIGNLSSNINTSTGIPFASEVVLDKTPIKKTLETFAEMTGHDVGVNGEGDFFFLPKNENVTRTFTAGYNLHELRIEKNYSDIKNRIIGKRSNAIGSGGAGWTIGAISIDQASQRKHGTQEHSVTVPGNMADADIKIMTDAVLVLKKDPTISAKAKTYLLRDSDDYIQRGAAKLILPYRAYEFEYDACDDPTGTFTATGPGDLIVAEDQINHIDGEMSMGLSWTSASGDYAETQQELKGNFNKMSFYYRPSRSGMYIRVGCGWGLWNEFTIDIPIPAAAVDNFVPFIWDLESYSIKRINRVGFQIVDSLAGSVSIDRIYFDVTGRRHLILENTKQVYKIGADEISIKMEMGTIPNRMEDYLAGLFSQMKAVEVFGEVR